MKWDLFGQVGHDISTALLLSLLSLMESYMQSDTIQWKLGLLYLERSEVSSVVQRLTRDRGVVGSSPMGGTALCP